LETCKPVFPKRVNSISKGERFKNEAERDTERSRDRTLASLNVMSSILRITFGGANARLALGLVNPKKPAWVTRRAFYCTK
jgi:hypothetical protein